MPTWDPRANDLFLKALELPSAAERQAYLDRACAGDVALRAEVEALLEASAQAGSFLESPAPAPLATVDEPVSERMGTVIGPYKLLQQLGEGGMGTVFMAEQTQPVQRKVALKIIKPGMDSRQVIARFEAERQALALMDHPNIAKVLDGGTTATGRPYFVMELVKGVPMTKYCDEHRSSPKQRLELFVPVCQAVQHAHQKGIIHRDLKPSNVLIALYDGQPVPKVIDFGVAKATGAKLTDRTLFTEVGQVVGTLEYMSPEQAELNQLDIDTRSDIYSLGVLLYELLTGSTPLERKRLKAAAILEVLRLIREEEPPRPSTRLSTTDEMPSVAANRGLEPKKLSGVVRGELDWIVMKALEKDRNRRYETANGFAMDVQRYLADEPVQACPPSAWYRFSKMARRNKGKLVVAAGLFLAVTLALGNFAVAYFVVSDSLQRETGEREKAEKLASDNKQLADVNGELAAKETKARLESDQRREEADELALRMAFNHLYSQSRDNAALALVGAAQLLPKARGLRDRALFESFLLHLRAWGPEVQAVRLGWFGEHGQLVGCVALSADGKTALTGSQDTTARLWETATGKPIGPPLQHRFGVNAVALSADAKTALSGSNDKTARLWETATGKPIGPPLQHQDLVWAVALSADGKIALTGSFDKTARLWETATGKPIGPPLQHQHYVVAAVLSADGTIALTGSYDKTARLWETATGKPLGPPLLHQAQVVAVALSADGTIALTGSFDKTARLWETATGKPIGPPLLHQDRVLAVALSADGKTALTGSFDNTARLWEAATGQPLGPPLQHQAAVRAVALSADGKTALTGSNNTTARLWDTATGRPLGPPLQHQDLVCAVALSADGKTALTGSNDTTARLWEKGTGKQLGPPLQHQGGVGAVALSADGKIALTGSADTTARLWETATRKPIGPPLQHQHWVGRVALSADGKIALTGSNDKTARLWETATGKPIGPPLLHQDEVLAVALSADGKIALTGSNDKTARLWETATGKPIGPPLQHQADVRAVALSADGKTALSGSNDKTARLWETATGKPIGPPLLHQHYVVAVALSADGKIALTGSVDKTARLWETATGKPIGPPLQHQDLVWAVALSADGKIALTGSGDRTARLWETATGKPLGPPLQHQGFVRAVDLSTDGKTALTGSEDRTARLWETATSKPLGSPLQHQGPVAAVFLSSDGKTALTGSLDKTARLWQLARFADDPERIALWAQVITGIEADPNGNARVLSADEWRERKTRLEKLGGPPLLD